MSVLFVLVPLALLLVIIFVAAYAWSSRSGQFDDLTTPAMRVLHDEVTPVAQKTTTTGTSVTTDPEPPGAH